jgi:hypothetical protein
VDCIQVGATVGIIEGLGGGKTVGIKDGSIVGVAVGIIEGLGVGKTVGVSEVGVPVGAAVEAGT